MKTGMPGGIPGGRFNEYTNRSVVGGEYVDSSAFAVEFYFAIDECEEGVVFALADTFAGVEAGAQLSDEDVSGDDLLAAEAFDAAALAIGIAAVAAGTLTFFMCHGSWFCGAKPQADAWEGAVHAELP